MINEVMDISETGADTLPPVEGIGLANTLRCEGVADEEALLYKHEGWLKTLAGSFEHHNPGVGFDDMMQAGRLALLKHAETFNPAHGGSLLGYSKHGVVQAMLRVVAFEGPVMRRPTHGGYRAAPIPIRESLDELVQDGLPLHERLEAPAARDEVEDREHRALLAVWLEELPTVQREILKALYLKGMSLREIGAERGVSYQAVHYQAMAAVERLRRKAAKHLTCGV
jgi:RNA polymerase sigma factor (sigma-70 family)